MLYEAIKDLRTGQVTLEPAGRRLVPGLEVYMARMNDLEALRKLYPAAVDRTKPAAGHAGDEEHGAGYLPNPGPGVRP